MRDLSPLHVLPAGHKFRCDQCGENATPIYDHNDVACHSTPTNGLYCTYGPTGQFWGNHTVRIVPIDAAPLGPCHCTYCGKAGCPGRDQHPTLED